MIEHEPFRVIVADNPWKFRTTLPGPKRSAHRHYRCLTVSELMRFPLPAIADDATLVLWRVGGMQAEALKVIEAWGFEEPYGEIVWIKTKAGHRPTSDVRIGMGYAQRNAHEVALTCKRGKGAPVLSHSEDSLVFAPREDHSEKPQAFYDKVRRLFAGPYFDLFARQLRPGWVAFGDQIPGAPMQAIEDARSSS